jgi:hypothetical protein
MERRRWSRRTAWGGGIATAAGIVLFTLFSDAGGSCTANVIVLSNGVIGPHGCAASSIAYHAGIGLMVLGSALLVGACVLAVVGRPEQPERVVATTGALAADHAGPAPGGPATAVVAARPQTNEASERRQPLSDAQEREDRPRDEVMALPPGWYGNPSNPNGSVQWWDGHRLLDRPPRASP